MAVKHMPSNFQLQLRGGIHSGAVATGVIGTNAPRFCLFGDTVCSCGSSILLDGYAQVNTASRMESSGEPMRVQVSEATQRLLTRFTTESRGTFEVKVRPYIQINTQSTRTGMFREKAK